MILIVDNDSRHIEDLKARMEEFGIDYILEDRKAPLKEIEAHTYDGMILSGSWKINLDHKIYFESIADDIACLLELTIPVLGICFGHQVIGVAYGGKIEALNRKVKGQEKVTILDEDDILKGLGPEIKVRESHHLGITKIPYRFKLLACSESCDTEAMRHKSKPVYGVQFHPEASGETGKKVLKNFLEICGESITEA